jgi:hypothetical protein
MLSPSVTAVLAGLGKADKSVTEASFELDAPMVEQRRQAGPGGGVVRDMVLQQVSSTTMIEFPKMTLPDGAVVRESEVAGSLMRSAWLTGDEAGRLLSGALDHGQVDALLRDARIRAISRLGVSEATAALIFDLAAKKTPKETFAGEVLDLVTSRGETVTPEFLQALVDIDAADEANPLSFKGGDPGDIEIELEGEVCVEVSVPPFVKVSVCVKVKVKGKLRDMDALRRALAEALEQVRQELEQKIRKQLEDLKKLIEDLIRQFRKWMEQLDLPWWLRQIFMGLKAGTPIGEDIAQNAIVGGIAEN